MLNLKVLSVSFMTVFDIMFFLASEAADVTNIFCYSSYFKIQTFHVYKYCSPSQSQLPVVDKIS